MDEYETVTIEVKRPHGCLDTYTVEVPKERADEFIEYINAWGSETIRAVTHKGLGDY